MKRFLLPIPFLLLFSSQYFFAQVDINRNQTKLLTDTNKIGLVDLKSDPEIQRLNELKANLTTSQQKLSTDLLQLIRSEFLPKATSLEHHSETMKSLKQFKPFEQSANFEESISEGTVYVYVYLNQEYSTSVINSYSEIVTDRDEKNHIVVAWVKAKNLEALASLNAVKMVRTVMPPVIRTGSVTTEGDAIHRTSNVRTIFDENGTGVNVGIISDGVDTRSTAQVTGDIPADGSGLTVLSNTYGGDEGTAMLEIVHDMVPGAELYFHDLGGNTLAFNSAIDDLVTAGNNIICDDIGWLLEPFYEDGVVASHINSVINSNDIIYVSSAGNAGDSHYQGDFFPSVTQPTQHDFSEGGTTGAYLYLPLAVGEQAIIVLQWDDQFGDSGNDYDLYLYNYGTASVVASSENFQSGAGDPLEYIVYTRPVGGPASYDYAIIVDQYSGSSVNLEVFIYAPANYSNNIKAQDAIFGHAAVDDVVSVGAVRYTTTSTIEFFSSQGPSTITFPVAESRQTPKIVGVDGGVITGAGGFGSFDGINYRFYGTSASAPHVAAVLSQAWSYDLLRTGQNIRQLLYDYPEDLGSIDFDPVFGYGRADALNIFNGELPVELTSFSATTIGSKVKLIWNTATEVNNYGFEVERSVVKGEWDKIGFVNGNGNSNSPKDYSFVDDFAGKPTYRTGRYSYRLKQIDNDGQFEYSKTIEVDMNGVKKYELTQNYPNPFNPTTTISYILPQTGMVRLTLYNILGQEIRTLVNEVKEAGTHTFNFDASDLNSGMYIYKIESGSFTQTRKMTLVK
ncbi:MAG: T9SS type A sorting domain-containing protein [Ignavibacteriales bacterium]|nr:T9SS type A sorting domain-containing protein [Ignavibacteriales bacterium]